MMGREHLMNLYHLRSEGVAVVAIADPHLPSQQLALHLAHSFGWPLKVSLSITIMFLFLSFFKQINLFIKIL